jgi:hypothetical protein
MSVENGRIFIILQKQYEESTKLALVSWQPHFSVKADAKEFSTLSDFDQNVRVKCFSNLIEIDSSWQFI